jgi:hypothetical protein
VGGTVRGGGGGRVPARRDLTGLPRVGRTPLPGTRGRRYPDGVDLRGGVRTHRRPTPPPAGADHPPPDGPHGRSRRGPCAPTRGGRGRTGVAGRGRRAGDAASSLRRGSVLRLGPRDPARQPDPAVAAVSGGGRESNPPEVRRNLSPVLKTGGPTRRPDTSLRGSRGPAHEPREVNGTRGTHGWTGGPFRGAAARFRGHWCRSAGGTAHANVRARWRGHWCRSAGGTAHATVCAPHDPPTTPRNP